MKGKGKFQKIHNGEYITLNCKKHGSVKPEKVFGVAVCPHCQNEIDTQEAALAAERDHDKQTALQAELSETEK